MAPFLAGWRAFWAGSPIGGSDDVRKLPSLGIAETPGLNADPRQEPLASIGLSTINRKLRTLAIASQTSILSQEGVLWPKIAGACRSPARSDAIPPGPCSVATTSQTSGSETSGSSISLAGALDRLLLKVRS